MFKKVLFAFVAVAVVAAAVAPSALSAHESREVGPYRLVVGFLVEPAFEGVVNAATVRVTEQVEGEAVGVSGLADTLSVVVTHNSTGGTREMELRSVFGQPGLYAADFLPTAPGGYTFQFTGTIGEAAIDETFVSGPETFNDIQASADVQFPVQLVEVRELQNAVQGMQNEVTLAADTADEAESSASTAMTVGIIGIVVGVLGLGVGGFAAMTASRKSRS